MSYKVHKLDINMEDASFVLEKFLNKLNGEVISVIPNIARTSLLQIYGFSRKIDFLLIIEKMND